MHCKMYTILRKTIKTMLKQNTELINTKSLKPILTCTPVLICLDGTYDSKIMNFL
jgi:hypothetical protein